MLGPESTAAGRIKSMKNINPSVIEPATFRFVAHCLKQLRYRVPCGFSIYSIYCAFRSKGEEEEDGENA
jgi:hypothetical protein